MKTIFFFFIFTAYLLSLEIEFRDFLPHSFKRPIAYIHSKKFLPNQAFVLEQRGKIFTINLTTKEKSLVLNLSDRLTTRNEEGLLSMVLDPFFDKNHKVYLFYTTRENFLSSREAVISSFIYNRDKNLINLESEEVLLNVEQPYSNHNGGQLKFGNDSYLYIALGDGGAAYDPKENGQNRESLLGAILRIDVHQKYYLDNYAIPEDNPFYEHQSFKEEIFSYGLRNPWRFSFDRKTGKIFCADVGQNRFEEINIIEKGKNYGWNIYEGNERLEEGDLENYQAPIFTYGREDGYSITGGYVYRGTNKKAYGKYFFADYGEGNFWAIDAETYELVFKKNFDLRISSFAEDEDGELYVCSFAKGKIYKIFFY